MASSSSMTSVPVASWVRVWSIRRPISAPGTRAPCSRWLRMSFWDTFIGCAIYHPCRPSTLFGAAGREHCTGPRGSGRYSPREIAYFISYPLPGRRGGGTGWRMDANDLNLAYVEGLYAEYLK